MVAQLQEWEQKLGAEWSRQYTQGMWIRLRMLWKDVPVPVVIAGGPRQKPTNSFLEYDKRRH